MNLPETLYIQYHPTQDTVAKLQQIQTQLKANGLRGEFVKPAALHLTILHIGYIAETFQQLVAVQPNLNQAQYQAALEQFIAGLRPQLLPEILLPTLGLAVFGHGQQTVVLELAAITQLQNLHALVNTRLEIFLTACGVDRAAVPARPRALQIQPALRPHISILKHTHVEATGLPDVTSGPIRLQLDQL